MMRVLAFIISCLILKDLQAQAPQGIPYQAIARNANGVAIANTAVKVRFSIRDSIGTGTIKYQETHNPTTSALGLFSVNVGMGTVLSGTFSGINWGKNAKFLQVELNTTGGTTYTDLGTTQMMSVPYALYSGSSNVFPQGGIIGQILTLCEDGPTWTTSGVCPGRISYINCSGLVVNGQLFGGVAYNYLTVSIPYLGGNGGPFESATFSSTGVLGLTAKLSSANFNNGSGSLILNISGTPASTGIAIFAISVGGQTCNISLLVNTLTNPVDLDGNTYQLAVIGSQVWMKENLKVSKYRNGDLIPSTLNGTGWISTNSGASAVYNEDLNNINPFGRLYNWYAVADSRGLCPTGWHVPNDDDWSNLYNYLGGTGQAGGKLKATGILGINEGLWFSPNTDATNSSGFSGLPAGLRFENGNFVNLGYNGYWWSSSPTSFASRWSWKLDHLSGNLNLEAQSRQTGLSIRCLKD